MKCANCDGEATFTVTYGTAKAVNYCAACLPAHLRVDAHSGKYPLQVPKKARKKAVNEDLQGTSETGTSTTEESLVS